MKETGLEMEPVLLIGDHRLTRSIASCLERGGCSFTSESSAPDSAGPHAGRPYGLAILVTEEDLQIKKEQLSNLEKILHPGSIIAVNTETLGLDLLQENASFPHRIMGVNWTEPADTTCFLEIIANHVTDPDLADQLLRTATGRWNKDPYIIHGNTGIRMRLTGALIREAFYLVKNGYATVEDIDRACRNDAGYYLPFAGNLRYMDLMGTYAYGMVMKDLNPELSTDGHIPEFFQRMLTGGNFGMESGAGFYSYAAGEHEKWQELMGEFGRQVRELFDKYPFQESAKAVAEPVRSAFDFD